MWARIANPRYRGLKFGSAYIGNKIDGQIDGINIATPAAKALLKVGAERANDATTGTIIDKTCKKD